MKNSWGLVLAVIGMLGIAAILLAPRGVRSLNPVQPVTAIGSDNELPDGWFNSLRRDAIAPIYDPTFMPRREVDWPPDALVIGVEVDGDARAYPASYLNRREMVNDVVGGEPLLVSW